VVGVRARELDEVKRGIQEIRSGDVSYQIPPLKCEDLKELAENVNGIAQGLDEAVSARVKAERMKTELITNVSHDLKTPITSIISYTELLSGLEGLPEEAQDYVAVISKKGARLKRLTQDLFDVSRAQSGNEEVLLERLDVALLISQALGEQDREIQASGLVFCVDTPKELYVRADGRKMSRVLSNLIQNILKYSLAGTRVFVTAALREGRVEIICKNTSAYPLDFDEEEITGRFVRGDESRTADGNGLGLAIAKSYTELCGGDFRIAVDGDLFKAILTFDPYEG
jgi:signal transduction histidine kinase